MTDDAEVILKQKQELLLINDLGRSVTPTFLSRKRFIYNYLHIVQK